MSIPEYLCHSGINFITVISVMLIEFVYALKITNQELILIVSGSVYFWHLLSVLELTKKSLGIKYPR